MPSSQGYRISRGHCCGCGTEMDTKVKSDTSKKTHQTISRRNETSAAIKQLALLFLFTLSQYSTVLWIHVDATSTGVWKTGPWGPCGSEMCGPGGLQLRSVACEDVIQHYKTRKENCQQFERPTDRRPCFKICDEHRYAYSWDVGPWEVCLNPNPSQMQKLEVVSNCGIHSSPRGVQIRQLRCVKNSNTSITVDDAVCERFFSAPNHQQSCRVPCPQNCVASLFSSWSACSATCGNGTRTRTRSIVRVAKYGGVSCPMLSESISCEEVPCKDFNIATNQHNLKFGEWSTCRRAKADLKSIERSSGSQRNNRRRKSRVNVRLVGTRTRQVDCLTKHGAVVGGSVSMSETCSVPQSCKVTSWSEWSRCSSTCGANGTQTRTRDLRSLPLGNNASADSCPDFKEVKRCILRDGTFAPCKTYRWLAGGWSQCQLIHNASCGGGLQWRHVYCALSDDFTFQQVSDAYTLRGDEGAIAWSRIQPVDNLFCEMQDQPSQWQECDVKCNFKCDLGLWSEWSECAFDSCQLDYRTANQTRVSKRSMRKRKGFRRRTRLIHEDHERPEDCSHTLEVIPCDRASCFSWQVSHISRCIPENGRCGHGTALQTLECRNLWRDVVDASACTSDPYSRPLASFVPCNIPCAEDCVLGDWSQWTPCGHSCKRGKGQSQRQTRKREVLAFPGRTGVPCPHAEEMQETRLCNQHRCSVYYWTKSRWGECEMKDNLVPPPVGLADRNLFVSSGIQGGDQPLIFPHNESSNICGIGYQTRRVHCRKKDSRRVRQKMCINWDQPVSTRSCLVSCSQDCLLSEWTSWSTCESECSRKIREKLVTSDAFSPAGLLSVYQRRSRYIVRHRVGGGVPCEIEMQQARLCDDASQCVVYKWHISKWGPCILAVGMSTVLEDGLKCRGIKTRTMRCYLHTISGNIPTDEINCLQKAGPIPHASRPCAASCRRDLAFSEWLERLGCQPTIIDATTITVTADVTSSDTTTGDDDSSYVPPQMIVRSVGPWSSCFIDPRDFQDAADECPVDEQPSVTNEATQLYDVTMSPGVCGRGRRKRPLGCFEEQTGVMVDISFCSYRAFDEEDCEVPCPADCQMSGWAEWGSCGDLLRGQIVRGNSTEPTTLPCGESQRIRFKYFMELPSNGGRSCPVLDSDNQVYESKPCHSDCNDNFFVTHGWATCQLRRHSTLPTCGTGVQTRAVDCYQSDPASSFSNVALLLDDKRLCDVDNMPLGADRCTLPCPGQCVVSKWSTWQPCTGGILGSCEGAVRTRSRRMLRQTDSDVSSSDIGCPDGQNLTQTERCHLNVNCFTYSAIWTEWSSCLAPRPALCGEGRMKRRMNCIQSNGLPVHTLKCVDANVTIESPQSRKCRVECPVDCVVTEWSAWGQCSETCGVGRRRQRVREVSRQASRMGRKCPVDLVQSRPCCAKPCYKWALLGWTSCSLTNGNCGVGSQEREVKCLQQDGTEVGVLLCKQQQMKQDGGNGQLHDWFTDEELRRTCHVACPGECQMTDWSAWSRCHADCSSDATASPTNIPGTKTRSRIGYVVGSVPGVRCPPFDIEEATCPSSEAQCISYSWKVGPYIGHTREVWCATDDDGSPVSTGCQEALKPTTSIATPYCPQPCDRIDHGFCTVSGVCDCRLPYIAVYQSSSNLYLRECDSKQHDQGTQVQETVDFRDLKDTELTHGKATTFQPPVIILPANNSKENDVWSILNPVKSDGSLKVWAYGAIAGLVVLLVFVIALCYLIYSACCRASSHSKQQQNRKSKRHRRSNSSGSNVGIGIMAGSVGGSAMYGVTGVPPYRINSHQSGSQQYTARSISRTPSVRSGFTFPDRYDSDLD